MGEKINLWIILIGKPEGKRPLWRHSQVWDDDIKMDIKDIG